MILKLTKKGAKINWKVYVISIYTASVALIALMLLYWLIANFESKKRKVISNHSKLVTWQRAGIKNYSFLLNSSCFPFTAKNLRIEVRDGQRVWPRDHKYKIIGGTYPTLEQLFSIIDNAQRSAHYHRVYFDKLGFPRFASIDWDQEIVDEECGFTVQQFRILSGLGPIPSIHKKTQIEEPRFFLPGEAFLYENCCSVELRTTEERDVYLKRFALPKSIVTDSF